MSSSGEPVVFLMFDAPLSPMKMQSSWRIPISP
jgi:hypothetical protein